MLPGDYAQTADVRHLDTYAIVAGTRREIESVSLDREIANDLPEQIVGGGGLAGGTGTIVWAPQYGPVQEHEVSPWHPESGWPPQAGDRVQVYVTDGTTSWPRFTGRIDKTTGVVGGRLQSTLVDFRDQMRALTTRDSLLRYHVPRQDTTPYRHIGLDYWFLLTRALRYVNIFNTPPAGGEAALQAPLQGSSWPVTGTLDESLGPGIQTNPRFHRAPWGQAVGAINAKYLPPSFGEARITAPWQIAFQVAPDHAGDAHVQLYFGESRIRVRVWESKAVTAYWNDDAVATLSQTQMEQATTVVLLVKGSSWTLRTDTGQEATGTRSRSGTAVLSHIWVRGTESARFAGVGVDSPNSSGEWRALSFTPNMTYETSNLISHMDMSASHENEDVADLVDEICKATLTGAWFDEMGILRFVPSDRLRARTPVQTLTSLDDITELEWETSLLSIRSKVNVTWQSALVSRTRLQRKELYRASAATLGSGDEIEVFAQPDSDVEWFGVDWNPQRLNDSNWGSYGAPGSKMGVYYTNSDNEELRTSSQTTTMRVERLGLNTLKITHIAGSYDGGVEGNLGVSENDTVLREKHKGDNLPVIRGRAEGRWVDEMTTRILSTGYGDPELTHDLGPWGVQFAADRIADFLAERVRRGEPTIRRLAVTYDPRRQLGDVVNLELGILGVRLRALIVGLSESHDPGEYSQNLTVRIIDATTTREVTYNDLAQAWAGRDYNALQAVWANLTYNDFTANPLEGA
jgi:hypothetical protein